MCLCVHKEKGKSKNGNGVGESRYPFLPSPIQRLSQKPKQRKEAINLHEIALC